MFYLPSFFSFSDDVISRKHCYHSRFDQRLVTLRGPVRGQAEMHSILCRCFVRASHRVWRPSQGMQRYAPVGWGKMALHATPKISRSLPFPWTLSLHRLWCPSASHHPVSFLFLLAQSFPLHFPFLCLGLLCPRSPSLFHFSMSSPQMPACSWCFTMCGPASSPTHLRPALYTNLHSAVTFSYAEVLRGVAPRRVGPTMGSGPTRNFYYNAHSYTPPYSAHHPPLVAPTQPRSSA